MPRAGDRFNEAAGIPRGRPPERLELRGALDKASMRPRVFPAEDTGISKDGDSGWDASMRPRVFPAEDTTYLVRPSMVLIGASMRPRVFPAEDAVTFTSS